MDTTFQPHSIDAEQAVIGAALGNNIVIGRCPWLQPEHFFEPTHSRIWAVMQHERMEGRIASPETILRFFEDDPTSKDMQSPDGKSYLFRLANGMLDCKADHDRAVEISKSVLDLFRLRELIRIAESMGALALDRSEPRDSASIIAEYRSELDGLCIDDSRPSGQSIATVTDHLLEDILNPKKVWSTGSRLIDESLGGGIPEGYVIGIEARAKSFKTGVAHTLLLALAQQNVSCCYIALEMGSRRLAQRMLAQVGGFNSSMFRHVDDQLMHRVERAREHLDHLQILFLDAPGCRFSRLKAMVNQAMQQHGCRVFVLDYWQLVTPDTKIVNKADFLAEVAQWCADHAHKHGTTWIVTSQENRGGESYGSDGLIKACDWMAVLHKHDLKFSSPRHDQVETLWLDVKFARDGSGDSIGDPDHPLLYIHPCGPHLAEI